MVEFGRIFDRTIWGGEKEELMNKNRLLNEDRHHIVFGRVPWEQVVIEKYEGCAIEIGRELRQEESLIVPMDRVAHEELHKIVHPMPPLGPVAVQAVFLEYTARVKDPSIHPVKAIDQLQMAIEEVPSKLLTFEEEDIVELCLDNLDSQIRLIRNAVNNRRRLYEQNKNKDKTIKLRQEKRNGRQMAYSGRR